MTKRNRICLGPLDEAPWLEARKKYVTATQAPALVPGFQKYNNPTKLAEAKLGYGPKFTPNKYTVYGSEAEHFVCHMAHYLLQVRTRLVRYPDPTAKFMLANQKYPGISATPDALISIPSGWTQKDASDEFGLFRSPGSGRGQERLTEALEAHSGEMGLLELKTTHSKYAERDWAKGPPKHYWAQVQVQLGICDYNWGVLWGKLPGPAFVGHFIERDDEWLTDLQERVKLFWRDVAGKRADLEEFENE